MSHFHHKIGFSSYSKPSTDTITDYTKRIDFLKGVISAMKLSNPVERVVAAQLLPKSSTIVNDSTNITTQIHQKTVAKYNQELRSELFHTNKSTINFLSTLRMCFCIFVLQIDRV